MKVLFITPHLSTGGLPQYLLKKVQLLNHVHEIFLIEYENITGNKLVVQRAQLESILGSNFISLNNKKDLTRKILEVAPDIIHMEEIPEMWLDYEIACTIYTNSRPYKIFETSHDSSFDISKKLFFPDKFLLVSQWQINLFSPLGIPCELVEYPIEIKNISDEDKTNAFLALNLDSSKKHIINVGLFTSRKNQAEAIEYARELEHYSNIQFHFIGNQADNFKSYWEPLMKNLPSNVKIWGERSDVDNFYKIASLFLFTSRGNINDKETMPLVIREAISYNIPSLIYNLDVYLNYFDKFKNISYLDKDISKNKNNILEKLGYEPEINTKDVIIISSYPINSAIEELTKSAINHIKDAGLKIILASHCPVSAELQDLVDYVVYDKNNILIKHDYYATSWYDKQEYYAELNIKKEGNDLYHGPAVYTNYYNGIHLAKSLRFETAYCMNFDMILDKYAFEEFKKIKKETKGVFNLHDSLEGKTLRTVFHVTDVNNFCETFPKIESGEDYENWRVKIGSESNGLENMYYHTLKNKLQDYTLLNNNEYYTQFKDYQIDICSMIEYYTVLAVENQPDKFVIWVSTANQIDNRIVNIALDNVYLSSVKIDGVTQWYKILNRKEINKISFVVLDSAEKILSKRTIVIDNNYNLRDNGFLRIK